MLTVLVFETRYYGGGAWQVWTDQCARCILCMSTVLVFETRYYGGGGVAPPSLAALMEPASSLWRRYRPLPTHVDPYAVFETRYYGGGGRGKYRDAVTLRRT